MLNIINFRSPHLRPEELQDIVILCNEIPTEKEFELISKFPRVFIMEVKKNINISSSRELNSMNTLNHSILLLLLLCVFVYIYLNIL